MLPRACMGIVPPGRFHGKWQVSHTQPRQFLNQLWHQPFSGSDGSDMSASDSDASSFWSTRVTQLTFLENLFNVFLAAPDPWRIGKKPCKKMPWTIVSNLKVAMLSWPVDKYSCEFWMILVEQNWLTSIEFKQPCNNILVLVLVLVLVVVVVVAAAVVVVVFCCCCFLPSS